ncbi:hypothetical protein RU99_GL001982 [Enterococcus casseliflavus]|nr:hypothetical protein RU99_GL001982 [Enterococcus casseliflavus]
MAKKVAKAGVFCLIPFFEERRWKHQRKISGKINRQHPIATQHLLYEGSYKLGEM